MTTERIDSVMLVSNGCNPDPRVQKEARSLAARGYRVQVWAWDRSATLPPRETRDGYEIVRYARASRTGTSLRQLSGFLGFWLWAMRRGFRGGRPRLVHCHDIDVFIPAFFLSRRWRVPLVLDSHELYGEMQASAGRPKPLVALLRWVERRFVRLAHAAIVVGNATREYFMRVRPDLTIVGNWYEPVENAGPLRDAVRQELGIPPNVFVITFVGGLQTTKFLEPLIAAVDADERLWAIVAGGGEQEEKLRAVAARQPRFKFVGYAHQPHRYYAAGDALYYLFNEGYDYADFLTGNTVGMAFAHRKPLITDRRGDAGRITMHYFPDLLMQKLTGAEVLRVVELLRVPGRLTEIETTMRRAADEVYSWGAAERELAATYERLLSPA